MYYYISKFMFRFFLSTLKYLRHLLYKILLCLGAFDVLLSFIQASVVFSFLMMKYFSNI